MRFPREVYQVEQTISEHLTNLRPAQRRGLALWVYGAILAKSACQDAVVVVLLTLGTWNNLRQYLREWLYDGKDRAAPCQTEIDISLCFVPLLSWVLKWWQGKELALAVDATQHGGEVVALVVSVLYRGSALPVAWHTMPAEVKGGWMGPLLGLLRQLRPAVPKGMMVLVLADQGLWSPRLWKRIKDLGWHPYLRVRDEISFRPEGGRRCPVRWLVAGPGHAWVGKGEAFKDRKVRRKATLVIVWGEGQEAPWVVLTDLEPEEVGVSWYGLRVWIELGFKA